MASREAGVARQRIYEWLDSDPAFRHEFELARETAHDALEAEAFRRGVEGWDEPVFYQGERVGEIRRYSDRMLELLLRGARPAKYKPGADGSTTNVTVLPSAQPNLLAMLQRPEMQELVAAVRRQEMAAASGLSAFVDVDVIEDDDDEDG